MYNLDKKIINLLSYMTNSFILLLFSVLSFGPFIHSKFTFGNNNFLF